MTLVVPRREGGRRNKLQENAFMLSKNIYMNADLVISSRNIDMNVNLAVPLSRNIAMNVKRAVLLSRNTEINVNLVLSARPKVVTGSGLPLHRSLEHLVGLQTTWLH